jgi:hypothetical protein
MHGACSWDCGHAPHLVQLQLFTEIKVTEQKCDHNGRAHMMVGLPGHFFVVAMGRRMLWGSCWVDISTLLCTDHAGDTSSGGSRSQTGHFQNKCTQKNLKFKFSTGWTDPSVTSVALTVIRQHRISTWTQRWHRTKTKEHSGNHAQPKGK